MQARRESFMLEDELVKYVRLASFVPKNQLLSEMAKNGYSRKDVNVALSSLLKSGVLVEKKVGRSTAYALPPSDLLILLKEVLESQKRVEIALGISAESFEKEFQAAYQKVKDVAGIATLKDVRQAMNMNNFDFYSKFQKIADRYRLSPGGDEGIIVDGNIWGVIMGNA